MREGNALEAGFGTFRECLRYKLARQGKTLIVVDRAALTTRTCSACGFVRADRPHRKEAWVCPKCGAAQDREVNAAKNIKAQGLEQYFNQEAMRESA